MNKDEIRGYLKAYCDQTDTLVQNGDLSQDNLGVKLVSNLRLYFRGEEAKQFLLQAINDSDKFCAPSFAKIFLSYLEKYFEFEPVHFEFKTPQYNYNYKYTTQDSGTRTIDLGTTFCGDWLEFYES
jgi:hypothetical protein